MSDHTHPLTDPAARVTITIEIGANADRPHVMVKAPTGVTPDELARALDVARKDVSHLESVKTYVSVEGTLPLFADHG